jgi:uncharacterized membrane protein required for colicin V production
VGFLPSWLNPYDILIVFILLVGAAWGFVRGLVRMALSLVVLYIAAVLAMTFYDNLGRLISYMASSPIYISEAIAFLFIMAVLVIAFNAILRRTYRDTELPGIRQIDQLGGMIIGFVIACLWIGFGILVLAFVLGTPVTEEDSLRLNLIGYFQDSSLIPVFYNLLPVALATLRPWMPRGLPPDIFTIRP